MYFWVFMLYVYTSQSVSQSVSQNRYLGLSAFAGLGLLYAMRAVLSYCLLL